MKKHTRFIFLIFLLLVGITKADKQDQKEMIEKSKENGLAVIDDKICEDNRYLIKPLEEYPFDCDVLYKTKQCNGVFTVNLC